MHEPGETDIATFEGDDTTPTSTHITGTHDIGADDASAEDEEALSKQAFPDKPITREQEEVLDEERTEKCPMQDFVGPKRPDNIEKNDADKTPVTDDGTAAKTGRPEERDAGDLNLVMDIPVHLTLEVGGRRITIGELMAMKPGDVISLDRGEEEPLDVKANGILIARGEVVLVNDRYGIRLLDIVSPSDRLKKTSTTRLTS